MATCGWVWKEWTDILSIARWEEEGGSYESARGIDALERADIIRAGFAHWFSPWIRHHYGSPSRVGGYIYGMVLDWALSSAYRAGLHGEDRYPIPHFWNDGRLGPETHQRLHEAFMVGVTDDQTRAELAKWGYLP